jgi:uncharacterized Zn-finger protein
MGNLKYEKNEEGEFICPTCGITKKKQNTMHYHMKKHADSLPYSCRYCKKEFLQKQTLEMHIRSRHADSESEETGEPEFECPFEDCKFMSMTKGNLRTHCLRTHFSKECDELCLQEKDSKEVQCVQCERVFTSKGAFYYHCFECIETQDNDERIVRLLSIGF